ncbi:DUF1905 domain-containing protein [Nakamurella leprariae]|uniref:DUF1905 domain-containing protein n=1 Tax=Nakamurella leprariae TaxID=2803911 RepID=A0A938YIY1_9ACTN|nr:DUF1905 domain-containing protein [Nakamurella leprariae]MBM9468635.1 DUF1905 domain-containing protein [Nakamurella leprariae]
MTRREHRADAEIVFEAVLERDGAEAFLTLPDRATAPGMARTVEGMIDGLPFTAVARVGPGGRRLPVREDLRRRVRKEVGESVTVRMWPMSR